MDSALTNFKNTLLPVQTFLSSKGRLLDLSEPLVMGILNATPDSFYTKGKHNTLSGMVQLAAQMIHDGVDILDVGGASTRPGATPISVEEEIDRVAPVIEMIHREFPDVWISVDTYRSDVAKAAVAAGASIVNDISAGELDAEMFRAVGELQVPYIAMHMQGTPETMQLNPKYNDVVKDIAEYLKSICFKAAAAGIRDLVLDPGFGFGKTDAHNFTLLNQIDILRILGKPILAGISRKSMICRTLGVQPEEALNGTTALHMVALQRGVTILRVHDVKEAKQTIRLFLKLQEHASH